MSRPTELGGFPDPTHRCPFPLRGMGRRHTAHLARMICTESTEISQSIFPIFPIFPITVLPPFSHHHIAVYISCYKSLLFKSLTFPIVFGHTLCLHLTAAKVPKLYIIYIALYYIILYYIILYYIILYYITLHYHGILQLALY